MSSTIVEFFFEKLLENYHINRYAIVHILYNILFIWLQFMNTKIYYYFIWALIISIIGVLAFQNTPSQIQGTNIPVVIDTWTIVNIWSTDSGSLITWTQNNSLVYTNTEYWFQLTLPEGWEDYRVFFYKWNEKFPRGISITLPTTMPWYKWVIDPSDNNNFSLSNTWSYTYITGYAVMLDISILDKNTYEIEYKRCKIDQEPWCINDSNTLWHNDKYYYTISWPQVLTTDLDKQWWDRTYFAKISNTFKIL